MTQNIAACVSAAQQAGFSVDLYIFMGSAISSNNPPDQVLLLDLAPIQLPIPVPLQDSALTTAAGHDERNQHASEPERSVWHSVA
jgi:hypothetical protein